MLLALQNKAGDHRVLVNVRTDSVVVSVDDMEVYSFDRVGRLLTAWVDGQTFVRTLDNRLIKKWRDLERGPSWKSIDPLSARDKECFLRQTWKRLHQVRQDIRTGVLDSCSDSALTAPPSEPALSWLDKILDWDFHRLESERDRFFSVYKPVSILPPDQYRALVLQATEGCHWNRCTFCDFYQHTTFHIKSDPEFKKHIHDVKRFFAEAIGLRQTIFLGDANALVIPQERLLQIFDRINSEFPELSQYSAQPGQRIGGIYSFIDAFTAHKKTLTEFRQLKERNLRRVYLGLETGCDELLSFLNKPSSAEQALQVARTLKGAGLSLGVMVLIGVGGDLCFEAHIKSTVKVLSAMDLNQNDILYFSPLFETPDSQYSRLARQAGIRPLQHEMRQEQVEAIRSSLRFRHNRPKMALYDIREFVY